MSVIGCVLRLREARAGVSACLAVGCVALAGCGGSGQGSGAQRPFPGGIRPIGPADLTTNVVGLMVTDQPYLKHVRAHCPSGPVTRFPVYCHFTATQVGLPAGTKKKFRQEFPGPYRVAGTIKVFGVYFRTKTYEYALNYAPTH